MVAEHSTANLYVYGFKKDMFFYHKSFPRIVILDDKFFESDYDVLDLYDYSATSEEMDFKGKFSIPLSRVAESLEDLISKEMFEKLKNSYIVFKSLNRGEEDHVFIYLLDELFGEDKKSSFILANFVCIDSSVFPNIATTRTKEEVLDVVENKNIIDHRGIVKEFLGYLNIRDFVYGNQEKRFNVDILSSFTEHILKEKSEALLFAGGLTRTFFDDNSILGSVKQRLNTLDVDRYDAVFEPPSYTQDIIHKKKAFFKPFILISKRRK